MSVAPSRSPSPELLALVLDAAREMSRHEDPAAVTDIALEHGRRILRFDRSIAATRRDIQPPAIRITRSDAPGTDFHDPTGHEEFPLLTRGVLVDLLQAGEPRLIDDLNFAPDDPAAVYLSGMRSLAAIPQFRVGRADDMVFHMRSEPHAFRPERFAELVLITSLFGQSLNNLARARELEERERSIREQYDIIATLSNTVMNSAMDLKHDNEVLEMRVRQRTAELTEANLDAIYMLALASEAKDHDTGEHLRRMQKLTRTLALEVGLKGSEAESLGHAAILHDVGKMHVPDNILKKPGPLNAEEMVVMQEHTVAGERILANKPFFTMARRIARSHHENWDGSGYPDATRRDAIPVEARIVHLADVYDALTSPRVYKAAWAPHEASDFIVEGSGSMFDPDLVKAFESIIRRREHDASR